MNNSGIYIHIPFCRVRCGYCDFCVITNLNIKEKYVNNLIQEIELRKEEFGETTFDTVFLGGGTPSLLSEKELSDIFNSLYKYYKIKSSSEITLEANPEDVYESPNLLQTYKQLGVNRISYGVQSFIEKELNFLNRIHTIKQISPVIENTKNFIDNISIDLIYSTPNQTEKELLYNLNQTIALDIKHLSAYTLIPEKDTKLYSGFLANKINFNDKSLESDLYIMLSNFLEENGFIQYEVSNYAKENSRSKHNLKYWQYFYYLSFGVSAHSFMNGYRWKNTSNIIQYNKLLRQNIIPEIEKTKLSIEEMNTEFIMLGLRSTGVNLQNYNNIFKSNFETKYEKPIKELINFNFAYFNDDYFRLTKKGYCITDEIIAKYF